VEIEIFYLIFKILHKTNWVNSLYLKRVKLKPVPASTFESTWSYPDEIFTQLQSTGCTKAAGLAFSAFTLTVRCQSDIQLLLSAWAVSNKVARLKGVSRECDEICIHRLERY